MKAKYKKKAFKAPQPTVDELTERLKALVSKDPRKAAIVLETWMHEKQEKKAA